MTAETTSINRALPRDPRWQTSVGVIMECKAYLQGIKEKRHFIESHAAHPNILDLAVNFHQIFRESAAMMRDIEGIQDILNKLQGAAEQEIYRPGYDLEQIKAEIDRLDISINDIYQGQGDQDVNGNNRQKVRLWRKPKGQKRRPRRMFRGVHSRKKVTNGGITTTGNR